MAELPSTFWDKLKKAVSVFIQSGDNSVINSQAGKNIVTGPGTRIIESQTYVENQTIMQEGDPVADADALCRAYLNRLVEQTHGLPLAGVDPKSAGKEDCRDLQLAAVYTALLTQKPEAMEGGFFPGTRQARVQIHEDRRLSALAVLNDEKRLALLGDPGSGKSTFVNFLALCLAGERLGDSVVNLTALTAPLPDDDEGKEKEKTPPPQPWKHGALLPVRVVLRDFAARSLTGKEKRVNGDTLWKFLVLEMGETLKDYVPHLKKELQEQGGLILLDGLDEVPEANDRRVQLKQAVRGFAADFPNCRFLVTSRTYAYQRQDWKLDGFAETVLAPFSKGQIRRFVERWYAHIGVVRHLSADDAQGRAVLLKTAIERNDRLAELAARPLLLTLMASLHAWRGGSLPEKREELYADAVDLLLDQWESPKVVQGKEGQPVMRQPSLAEWLKVDRDVVRRELNRLAFEAHREQPQLVGTADITQERLIGVLMAVTDNPLVNPAQLVAYLRDRAGLLLPRGEGVYTFPHRTFQEYLAACHLTDYKYPRQLVEQVKEDPQRWREVALLAGAKAARGTTSAAWNLAEALCYREAAGAEEETDQWRGLLAGQVLLENEGGRLQETDEWELPKLERIRRWQRVIVERGYLPPVDRALAGEALAILGDDRDLDALATIAEGEFLMGSKDESLNPLEFITKETPQHRVPVKGYKIGKYTVTNDQYRRFVEGGGYEERQWWVEAGWWAKEKGKWREPRFWSNSRYNKSNQPVVGVSWYEAVAYCRWLTKKWQGEGKIGSGEVVRLPSEAEWEKAARGTDGRTYPWGDEADPLKANYTDTGIGLPAAVGMFPGGVSPYGLFDCAGNVWEWCSTLFKEQAYPFTVQDEWADDYVNKNDLRVLRGGAFLNSGSYARCAARSWNPPYDRLSHIGFRVLVSPI